MINFLFQKQELQRHSNTSAKSSDVQSDTATTKPSAAESELLLQLKSKSNRKLKELATRFDANALPMLADKIQSIDSR